MKLSINNKSSKKGFTLIELLVVMAIIATLAGLGYGPVMKHLRTTDINKAKKVCKDLTFAIDGYESTYDSLPYTGDYPGDDKLVVTDDGAFLEVLMGINTDINYKGKKFFTADQAKGEKNGLVYSGDSITKLTNKWGNPYHILLDYSADGKVNPKLLQSGTVSVTGDSYKDELHADHAIIASPGPDGELNDKEDAKSW